MAVYIELENLPKPDIKKEIETSLKPELITYFGKAIGDSKIVWCEAPYNRVTVMEQLKYPESEKNARESISSVFQKYIGGVSINVRAGYKRVNPDFTQCQSRSNLRWQLKTASLTIKNCLNNIKRQSLLLVLSRLFCQIA